MRWKRYMYHRWAVPGLTLTLLRVICPARARHQRYVEALQAKVVLDGNHGALGNHYGYYGPGA